MTAPSAIDAAGVHKAFGGAAALRDASLTVERGQLVALLGPSGSGKTTLLRVIAGLEVPDAGGGVDQWAHRRGAGHVGRARAAARRDGVPGRRPLPPPLGGGQRGFGEPRRGGSTTCLELVGLADRARSFPHELSGGERQRVALARALAPEPEVVLLDEPFAALDATLRTSLREEVAAILRAAGASALLVTHDQQEALSLADVVVVMRDGAVEQVGLPRGPLRPPRQPLGRRVPGDRRGAHRRGRWRW